MSVAVHPNHLRPTERRPRPGHLSLLWVRIRRLDLDRRLAAGEDPDTDTDLAVRAGQLTDAGERRYIAMVLDRVVAEATGAPAPFSSKRPLARAAIAACAPKMHAITACLWGADRVDPEGVAKVSLLLREGSSPLYSFSTTEDLLRYYVVQISSALGPGAARASRSV